MVINEKLPFDFFSYHSYSGVEANVKGQVYVEKRLEKAGLGHVEIHLNEWNTNPTHEERGTSKADADSVANMCAMQNTNMAMMCFYDARVGVSVYGGLFNPLTKLPFCTYDGFKAFGKLYNLGTQIDVTCDNDKVYAMGATNGHTSRDTPLQHRWGHHRAVGYRHTVSMKRIVSPKSHYREIASQ